LKPVSYVFGVSQGRHAVDIALPFLLKRGLISDVQAVRYLAASLIQKISKAAGFLLKPHIPVLVETMLDSLTALEPTELNYLSLNADKCVFC
jgi:proteasome component ECM29